MTTPETTTPARPRHGSPGAPAAVRLFWLRAAVVIAPIGPLAIAVLRLVMPYDTVDDTAAVVGKVAASPVATDAVLWLSFLALFTLPLGVLVAARLAVRVRPVFGSVAAAVAWTGFSALFWVAYPERPAAAAVAAGVDPATATALIGAADAHPSATAALLVYVVGHILGGVLLGIALWGAVPRWAALALAASQPLHLVFAVALVNHALDAASWALTGVGFAAAAVAALRRAQAG
jgi:hypothetical protein